MQQQQLQASYIAEEASHEESEHLPSSAFRAREKQFQLHKVQQLRRSKGKVRGGKLAVKDTDFSGVLDLHTYISSSSTPPPPPPPPGVHIHSLPTAPHQPPPCAAAAGGSHTPKPPFPAPLLHTTTTAVTFDAHPGLVYLPAALPPPLQLQLMHGALCHWPQPPARTNHNLQHGLLPDLWHAAQAGLNLVPRSVQQQPQAHAQQQQHPAGQQQAPSHASHGLQQQSVDGGMSSAPHHQQPQEQPQDAAAGACASLDSHLRHHHHQQPTTAAPCSSSQHQEGASTPPSCWQQSGPGPSAQQLLHKLRWVSLGPPYNWTTRTYEPEAPHAPLPAVLQQAALLLVEVAAQALAQQQQQQQQQQQEQEQEQEESLQPQPQQRRDMQQQEQQQVSGEAAAAPEAAAGECNSAARPHGHTSAPTPEYHPDAALVNYYRSGDTLGGHKDDVERDMSQPIVSISLGCPAVFLMGGESRDVDPTPLLLRSGDVLVLGGPARRCFHGVPRVLPEQGLPPEVVTAAAAAAAEAKATVHLEANEQQAPSPQVLDVAAPAVAAGASAGTCRVDGSGVAQGSGACVDEVGAGGGLAAVVEYMSRARVNISIRATR